MPEMEARELQKQYARFIEEDGGDDFSTARTKSGFPLKVDTSIELRQQGIAAGVAQNARAKRDKFENNHGSVSTSAIEDIEGCVGQFVACHAFGFDLSEAFDIESFKGSDLIGHNVEVRSNYFPDGKGTLIAHWDDSLSSLYVLVIGHHVDSHDAFYNRTEGQLRNPEFFNKEFLIAGWCWGWELLQKPWSTSKNRQKRGDGADSYYQLPQRMLHDTSILVKSGVLTGEAVPMSEAPLMNEHEEEEDSSPIVEEDTPEEETEVVAEEDSTDGEFTFTTEVVVKTKAKRKPRIKSEPLDPSVLTKRVGSKTKIKEPRNLRYVFRKALKAIDIDTLKKPWMAEKAFRLISTKEELRTWVDGVLSDTTRHKSFGAETCPVIAVDTETNGLDTRILVDLVEETDAYGHKIWAPVYEVKIEISGICLSSDGIEGIYVPVTHELGQNIGREDCAAILQTLFDRSHLVFYNAKYDREVLRLTMGIEMRPYPHFEDVQVLAYINDPKADLGDKGKFTGEAGGLKALSKSVLGIEQIELDQIAKVKADYFNPITQKTTLKAQYAPFSWVPTDIALWYAAGDAICTWLLWDKRHGLARTRKFIHKIDHELVDSITWIERQRFYIDTERLARTVKGHQKKLAELRIKLRALALAAGYKEMATDDGVVLEDNQFNPGSTKQLQDLLFKVKKFVPKRITDAGNASCDAETLEDLYKENPEDEFLKTIMVYRDYMALHPDNLRFDPKDKSARMYLKQNVVAGGRLAGAGGDFERDGGFGLNPQGIKKIEGNLMWKVRGNVLDPDPEEINDDDIVEYTPEDLHPSCCKKGKYAPGIVKNHIGKYMGYAICLVPKCTTCKEKYGILIPNTNMDANEMINLRVLFSAPPGWTLFSVDYSNIEMRVAANVSGEPEFVNEFLLGKGDFHSLTASKVFPEFNGSTGALRKSFRDLAKIINFALLYGGTEFTIFENMKKKKPDITWNEAKDMVAKYWAGVPIFAEFCQKKQAIAREFMTCTTTTGRVINFKSAMEKDHIRIPVDGEKEAYWKYRELNKKSEGYKKIGDVESAARFKGLADSLWKDPATGVRNYMDYNKFMGKIQRVSVNVPLQGLAGDIMRMALNRIRNWVESDPLIQAIFHLNGSVHDEIDFIVKNEYVPFVLPRLTRLMKMRKMHERLKWPVPIESDAEYGRSWDVEHHVTGDDDHAPAAWTEIKELAEYLPAGTDVNTVNKLVAAANSEDPARVEKVSNFLHENLHPRAAIAIKHMLAAKEAADRRKFLITAIQLDEFWNIDNVPDDEGGKLDKLEDYEAKHSLGSANHILWLSWSCATYR